MLLDPFSRNEIPNAVEIREFVVEIVDPKYFFANEEDFEILKGKEVDGRRRGGREQRRQIDSIQKSNY